MARWQSFPELASRPGVCEVEVLVPEGADPHAMPTVLVDLPHGATARAHYDAVRATLISPLPDRLEEFFFVNTDVGSPEVARALAELAAQPHAFADLREAMQTAGAARPPKPRSVLMIRSLVPRTFIDCNRAADATAAALAAGALTGLLPEYITAAEDRDRLLALHRSYHEVAGRAHALVCGAGGLAIALHTYAPRSVGITTIDADIVRALRNAYLPEIYATWPERPAVDVVSEGMDGALLAPAGLVAGVRAAYQQAGVAAAENVTYRLHPGTMGARYAMLYPERVLSIELRRDLLAEPFAPFEEMRMGRAKVQRMAVPLAAAVLAWLEAAGTREEARAEAPTV